MKTLQTKLLIGFLPTLAILVGLGLWAIVMFHRLGGNIDVILRENYKSILAAEGMKEAVERMDSGLLFAVGGRGELGANSSTRIGRLSRPIWRPKKATSRCPVNASSPIHSSLCFANIRPTRSASSR